MIPGSFHLSALPALMLVFSWHRMTLIAPALGPPMIKTGRKRKRQPQQLYSCACPFYQKAETFPRLPSGCRFPLCFIGQDWVRGQPWQPRRLRKRPSLSFTGEMNKGGGTGNMVGSIPSTCHKLDPSECKKLQNGQWRVFNIKKWQMRSHRVGGKEQRILTVYTSSCDCSPDVNREMGNSGRRQGWSMMTSVGLASELGFYIFYVSPTPKSVLIKADAQYLLMVHETKTEDKQTSMAEKILTN